MTRFGHLFDNDLVGTARNTVVAMAAVAVFTLAFIAAGELLVLLIEFLTEVMGA